MNAGLQKVTTRFVVLLDPDFFIIRPNWIEEVLAYMQAHALSFFGVPYHVRWYRKYHEFPCAQALFIDLERVPAAEIDLLPDLVNNPTPPGVKVWVQFEELWGAGRRLRALAYLLRHLPEAVSEDRQMRRMISSSRDVGISVYGRYAHNPTHPSAIVQPVFRPGQAQFIPPGVTALQTTPLIEKWLPDQRRYLPRRPDYFSQRGFRECGLSDVTAYDWEEFMWAQRPFGFHMRGYFQRKGAQAASTAVAPDLGTILENLTGLKLQAEKSVAVNENDG